MAWAEDRAPWRHDPSADPGAKTEGGRHDAALSFPFGIGTKAANRCRLFQCAVYLISRPRWAAPRFLVHPKWETARES